MPIKRGVYLELSMLLVRVIIKIHIHLQYVDRFWSSDCFSFLSKNAAVKISMN